MKLKKSNIKKWLEVLDRQSNRIFGLGFSEVRSNKEWIQDYIGCHASEVIQDEIEAAI